MTQKIILALLALNAVTYLIYFYDKVAARNGAWRISEATLFWVAMLGGSPAAIAAMFTLRHKTRKPGFRYGLPVILFLQWAAYAYWVFAGSPDLITGLI